MLSFWVAIALLCIGASAFVAWPLLSKRTTEASPARAADDEARRLAIYRDRRREIEAERQAGRLTDAEAARSLEELVAEAAQQFPDDARLAAARGASGPAPAQARPRYLLSAVVALLVPAVALLVYVRIGSPGIVGVDPQALTGRLTAEGLDEALRELDARVAGAPGDAEAWGMLAQARKLKGDLPQAIAAFEKAAALMPGNARLLADFAETLLMGNGGDFSGRPADLLERAYRADPADPKVLLMLGIARYRLGNAAGGLELLRKVRAAMQADSAEARQVGEIIARIESETGAGGGTGAAAAPAGAPSAGAPSAGAASTAAPAGAAPAAGTPAAAAASASIRGSVDIDPALAAGIPADAVLYVSARAASGPRVPFAALRLTAGGWPVAFELGDAQAMDPSRPLSSAGELVIEARISRSGDAMRRSGDEYGVSAPVRAGSRGVAVRIDQKVP
ncbi:MAG TPA: c-type cytochrome biogenesis protein CcmI [Quisquiliibacterium sp.]|nr:c-type cytochrome biogenesis protein CcmI [Quisquiliibacterium sp.]